MNRIWVLTAACLVGGCAFFHRADSDVPDKDSSVPDNEVAGGAAVGSPGGRNVESRIPEPEVWIGQLWSASTVVCGPDGIDSAVTPEGSIARVTLVLESREGGVTGRIQFGESDASALPEAPWPNGVESSFYYCSLELPAQGVEYTMLDLSRTSERLSFTISPAEYWDGWCHQPTFECGASSDPCTKQPVCVCQTGACEAALYNRLSIQLGFTKTTLEGPFGWPRFGSLADIRLRRVK